MRVAHLGAFAALIAAAWSTDSARGEDPPPTPDVAARVDAYLRGMADVGLFSGTALVAKDGKVLAEAAYGKADVAAGVANTPITQFKLMSVSKTFTAVAVMRLVQDKKLDLEDEVAERLPSWPATWRGVTIHQLLEHTSGVTNIDGEWSQAVLQGKDRGLGAWKAFAPRLAARPLAASPGTVAAYSNFNYILLGLVVEATSGKPYTDFVTATILKPAGMTKTGFDDGSRRPGLSIGYFRDADGAPQLSVQDMSGIQAAGGFFSTVGDLYRYDRALRGESILSAATKTRMETPTKASPYYACGWQLQPVRGRKCVHHSGGSNGYVADFLRFPDDDAFVAVESNFAYAPIARLSDDLAAIVFGVDVPVPAKASRAELDACVGVYRAPDAKGRALVVRRAGDAMLVHDVYDHLDSCPASSLVPLAGGVFAMPYGESRLMFTPAADGRPARARMTFAAGFTDFDCVESPIETWKAAVGDYRTAPPESALQRIVFAGGRLTLRVPDGWPPESEIVPLSETLAVLRFGFDGGSLLHLEAGADGRAPGIRWQRNDGRVFTCTRQTK